VDEMLKIRKLNESTPTGRQPDYFPDAAKEQVFTPFIEPGSALDNP
jgi:hypothetical protein